jgi:hypothetical protein
MRIKSIVCGVITCTLLAFQLVYADVNCSSNGQCSEGDFCPNGQSCCCVKCPNDTKEKRCCTSGQSCSSGCNPNAWTKCESAGT